MGCCLEIMGIWQDTAHLVFNHIPAFYGVCR